MIRVRRYKPYFQIGAWLLVFAICLDQALNALDDTPVLGWLPEAMTGTGFIEDIRLRVSQAEKYYDEGLVSPDNHLVVFVGASDVREGVDLGVMAESVSPDWKLLGLGGAGWGIATVKDYSDLVNGSDLYPDLVVVGIGLLQLVDPETRKDVKVEAPSVFEMLRSGEFRSVAVAIRNSLWTFARRKDVNVSIEAGVLDLRAGLLQAFEVPVPQGEERERSPWRKMIKADWPEHFSDKTLELQESEFKKYGYFDLARYENSTHAMSMLLSIIDSFQGRGARVVVVLMPQRSTLSEKVPDQAAQLVRQKLNEAFADKAPQLLDYRRLIDDSGFVDLPHLNRKGSRQFSQELAKVLRDQTLEEKPLMAQHHGIRNRQTHTMSPKSGTRPDA